MRRLVLMVMFLSAPTLAADATKSLLYASATEAQCDQIVTMIRSTPMQTGTTSRQFGSAPGSGCWVFGSGSNPSPFLNTLKTRIEGELGLVPNSGGSDGG